MAVVSPSVFEVKIMYVVNSQQCMNVIHFRTQGSLGGGLASEITIAFLEAFAAAGPDSIIDAMTPMMSNAVNITKVTGQFVWPFRWRMEVLDVTIPGLVADSVKNQNVSAVIEKYGDQGNRHNIGSFHLGGMTAAQFSLGDIEPAAKVKLQTLADKLMVIRTDTVTTATYVPCILNKAPIPDTDPVKYEIIGSSDIVGTTPMDTARVMRRRTKGVGI